MNGRFGKFLLLFVVLFFLLRATVGLAGEVNAGSAIAGGLAVGAGVEAYREIEVKAPQSASKCSGDYWECFKAAAYVAGGAALIVTAVDSKKAKNKLTAPDVPWDPNNPNDPNNPDNPNAPVVPGGPGLEDLKKKAEQLATDIEKKSGIKVDTDTGKIVTPKKGPMSPGQLGSGAALADAGLIKPEQIAEFDANFKKEAGKMRIPAMNSSAGGGYSGNKGAATAAYEDPYANYGYGREKEAVEKPKTAGLVKLAGGEMIGASTGNIFEMIRKKYQEKTDQGIFVGQEPKVEN